jgi:hypothetical protein
MAASFASCVDESDFDLSRIAQTTVNPSIEVHNILETSVGLSDFLQIDLDSLVSSVEGLQLEVLSDQYGEFLNLKYNRLDTLYPEDMIKELTFDPMNFDLQPIILDLFGITGDFEIRAPANGFENERIIIPIDKDSVLFDSASFIEGSKLKFTFGNNVVNAAGYEIYVILQSVYLRNKYSGISFYDTVCVVGNNATPVYYIDLKNYNLKFDHEADNSAFFDLQYAIIIKGNANATPQENITVDINAQSENMKIDIAYGYVGHYDFISRDTVDIPYFNDTSYSELFVPNSIDMERFDVKMSVFTNIGIATSIYLYELASSNAVNQYLSLINNQLPVTILDHQAATTPHQSVEIPLPDLFSNIEGIESMPNKSYANTAIIFDKDAPHNFITPQDAYVAIKSQMDIPIKLRINNLTYNQDIDAFDVTKEMDYLKSATLMFSLENGFPAEVSVQFYISDSNNVIKDSILDHAVFIEGANVDNQGFVLSAKKQNVNVTLNSSKYDALRAADKIIMKAVLNTSAAGNSKPFIRLRHDDIRQRLNVKLGVKAQANITF